MSRALKKSEPMEDEAGSGEAPPHLESIVAWVGMLVRTLKTCRLYDEANPTVVRFREELAAALQSLLAQAGAVRLDVVPTALLVAGHQVHTAHSRDDNLAGVLYRDGIRALTFDPGISPREVEALVDRLLLVTGPSAGDDDLVTLLWDADVPHLGVDTVPLEGEADGGGDDSEEPSAASAWPRQVSGGPALTLVSSKEESAGARSDDWRIGDAPANLEEAFDGIESVALFEIARFQQEAEEEARVGMLDSMLAALADYLVSATQESDREEIVAFLPRVLRETLAQGSWRQAGNALRMLRSCRPDWSVSEFSAGLCGPFAITTRKVVEVLDQHDADGTEAFLVLGREFGPEVGQWLMHVLAESQKMRVRRSLARAIGEMLAGHPEQIAPWLEDTRWYVVRNAVHILGWMGTDAIAEHLQRAAGHPEPRVRREIVAALSQSSPAAARPILLGMLGSAEPDLFAAILHQLSSDPDPTIADRLLELFSDEGFTERSEVAQRALFRALATRGDAVLPRLEAVLHQGGLFSNKPEPNRTAAALCIARIGTPAARAALEKGLQSKRAAVRKACEIAGAPPGGSHD